VVEVIDGRIGAGIAVILSRTVGLDVFGPAENAFGAEEQDERALVIRHVHPLSLAALGVVGFLAVAVAFLLRLAWDGCISGLLRHRTWRVGVQPQVHRMRRSAGARQLVDAARVGQRGADGLLHGRFVLRQPGRVGAQCQCGIEQALVARADAGEAIEYR
jgi:hypothetical protein